MNYEFHVGDYVETVDEWVGYIESIHDLLHGVTGLYVRFVDGDCHCFEVTNETISSNFNRIGAYDFTKKEKKKIENLIINKTVLQYTGDGTSNTGADYTAVYDNTKFQDKMIDKINELVDAVNKLMDKEDSE